MAGIDKRSDGRYRARWREYPGGPQKTRHFDRKADADRFLDGIRGDLARGVHIDPSAGKMLFQTYAEQWRGATPSTVHRVPSRDLPPYLPPRPRVPLLGTPSWTTTQGEDPARWTSWAPCFRAEPASPSSRMAQVPFSIGSRTSVVRYAPQLVGPIVARLGSAAGFRQGMRRLTRLLDLKACAAGR